MKSGNSFENRYISEKKSDIPLFCDNSYSLSKYNSASEKYLILPGAYQSSDPLNKFLQTKRTNLTRSIKTIVKLIEQRETLHEQNLYQIEKSECELENKLLQIEHWTIGFNPVIDKRRSELEKELLDFEKQKRQEEVSAWKDVLSLKNQLIELTQELYKERSKKNLL